VSRVVSCRSFILLVGLGRFDAQRLLQLLLAIIALSR